VSSAGPKLESRESSPRLGILVVDDDASLRSLLERGLGQGGFTVYLAKDGPEAIAFYGQQGSEVDLVLLDICMPGLDGPQTLKALRQQYPAVRCCFISGHSGLYSEEQLLGMGVDYYFKKPFSLQEVAAKLKELLRG
jgi:DNA-binding response OmpR family regulator